MVGGKVPYHIRTTIVNNLFEASPASFRTATILLLLALCHTSAKHAVLHARILVLGLAKANWYVFMTVHVCNLFTHGHEKQNEKVQ